MPSKNPPMWAHTATPPVTFIPMLLIPARNCKTYHRPRKTTAGKGKKKKRTKSRKGARRRKNRKETLNPRDGAPAPPTGGVWVEVKKQSTKPQPHPTHTQQKKK